jgi:hypothetical protein
MNNTDNKFSVHKKPSNQVIVSRINDKFLIGKKFTKSTAIISPFEKIDGSFISNFQVPSNRSKRVQILYNMIPKISKYSVSEEGVHFDCIEAISDSTDILNFKNDEIESGVIHFDVVTTKKREEKESKVTTYVDINPRVIFAKLPEQEILEKKISNINHKFKTTKFKAFSVILEKGFILCAVDRNYTTLYLTINRPMQKFIGNCVKKEVSNITNNIFPLWPIFGVNMNQSKLGVNITDEVISDFIHVDRPILVKMEREMNDNTALISCMGIQV